MKKELILIGSTDHIDLPELDLLDLECKIDTGAFTSTIHCSQTKVVQQNGVAVLTFKVLDRLHPQFSDAVHSATNFTEKRVRSSNGQVETRYMVKTKAVLFGRSFPISFTLSNRAKMRFPVLLGKKFLQRKFVVDVAQRNLSFEQKEK